MPYRPGYGARRPTPNPLAGAGDEEAFRLVTIGHAPAPEGCVGRDWLVYRIAQGANMITGYRRGDLPAATAEVERIVMGLNERRVASKGRPGPKPKPRAATPPQTLPQTVPSPGEGDEAS
jgi:hypothetical protein